MSENTVLMAICTGHAQARKAIAELRRLGFDMTRVSVFGRAYLSDEEVIGCYTAGGRLRARGGSAAFWDRCGRCSARAGFSQCPELGRSSGRHGPFVRALVATTDDGAALGV